MQMNENTGNLRKMHALFCREIERQARQQVEHSSTQRVEKLRESLRSFGAEPVVTAQFVEVWEDTNGLLPPKVIAELTVSIHNSELKHPFDLPVGPFHHPARPERLFELCMLRAEAEEEMRGEGDGHALDRMLGLARELQLDATHIGEQ